jgi:hypothetical protein
MIINVLKALEQLGLPEMEPTSLSLGYVLVTA